MKILYTNFHAGDGGGHTTYITSLARLMHWQHMVHIAAPAASKLLRMARDIPGVEVTAMEFGGSARNMIRGISTLRSLMREKRPDIIHVNGAADHRLVMLALAGLGHNRPRTVFTKHNSKPCNSFGNAVRARWATDRVIAVSRHTREQLLDSPYRRCPVDVVHNGIDIERFTPWSQEMSQNAREGFAIPTHALLLGSSAGTASYKGWMDLVEALPLLPESMRRDIHVLVAGKMPDETTLDRIQELGLADRIHFTGLLEDVRPAIAATDAGFVLSHGIETISFACREMMAMGKPVLVSDYAGLPENITPGLDGWVVPARDRDAIAAQVASIFETREALPSMGQAARQKATATFGQQPFLENTEASYLKALRGKDPL